MVFVHLTRSQLERVLEQEEQPPEFEDIFLDEPRLTENTRPFRRETCVRNGKLYFRCPRCLFWKPYTAYYRTRGEEGKRLSYCMSCYAELNRAWHQRHTHRGKRPKIRRTPCRTKGGKNVSD